MKISGQVMHRPLHGGKCLYLCTSYLGTFTKLIFSHPLIYTHLKRDAPSRYTESYTRFAEMYNPSDR
jgi:hypothetical protein